MPSPTSLRPPPPAGSSPNQNSGPKLCPGCEADADRIAVSMSNSAAPRPGRGHPARDPAAIERLHAAHASVISAAEAAFIHAIPRAAPTSEGQRAASEAYGPRRNRVLADQAPRGELNRGDKAMGLRARRLPAGGERCLPECPTHGVHRGLGGAGRRGGGRRGGRVGFGTGGAVFWRTQPSGFWRDRRSLIAVSPRMTRTLRR
jgi:hypothetical protein